MKKILILVMFFILLLTLVACSNDAKPPVFTIHCIIDDADYSTQAFFNESFIIEHIPQKPGYSFKGYFDSSSGGTQYTDCKGMSLSRYLNNEDIELFPQFEPNQYNVILDYQGAFVIGIREFPISYGESIKSLPSGLELSGKVFMGWYTKPNKKGYRISDGNKVIDDHSTVSEENFDLTDNNIHLYAGFASDKTCSVIFMCDEGKREITVEYGEKIEDFVLISNEKVVTEWTTEQSSADHIHRGSIYTDMTVYPYTSVPYIKLDALGGKVSSDMIFAPAGAKITIPTPTKEGYCFKEWVGDMRIFELNSLTMPNTSCTLYAVWNPIIRFRTNGGTYVNDICAEPGTFIQLPVTAKSNVCFAGWYDGENKCELAGGQFRVPAESIVLDAKYYGYNEKYIDLTGALPLLTTKNNSLEALNKKQYPFDLKVFNTENIANISICFKARSSLAHKWGYLSVFERTSGSSECSEIISKCFLTRLIYKDMSIDIDLPKFDTDSTYYLCFFNDKNASWLSIKNLKVCVKYVDRSCFV